ncbi:hypothetical protein B0H10DRAFT_2217042 [Mycena sp. CBHHK59/15]|nr:hypothetical protein B0H10DRAFT_2217042 [Mycena sp. CBHHK59/15]
MDDWIGGPSMVLDHEEYDDDEEWCHHYVNMFVDRDMYVRYIGGGVGHYQVEVEDEPDLPDVLEYLVPEVEEVEAVCTAAPGAAAEVLSDEGEDADLTAAGGDDAADGEDLQGDGDDAPDDASSSDDDADKDSTFEFSNEEGEGEEGEPLVSDNNDNEDLGPEDGEGYVEEEYEEEYMPL